MRKPCQICGSSFNRTKYSWQIRGQKAWVCPTCNSALQKKVSAAAFGRDVDYPEVMKPDGCFLLGCVGKLALLFVVVVGASALFSDRKSPSATSVPTSNRPEDPALAEAKKIQRSTIPLFNRPADAVKVPFELGLSDTDGTKPAWRVGDPGWYGLAKIVTHKGSYTTVGDIDNDISCMHSSHSIDHVEYVRWTANHFNSADSTTPSKFKELCLAYARKLGCETPNELFVQVDPTKGQQLDTPEATFKLERLTYKIGYGWQFTITGKTVGEH